MTLPMSDRLRQLRRVRGLTQEELASHLGISYQAISKWERGESYPDITMLPILAHYFSVTVDHLMGMDTAARQAAYDEINRQWEENRRLGRHKENVELMQQSLREYPNDSLLLVQLSASLERLDGTPEERAIYLRESIAVQEQILRYGEDSAIRGSVMYNICYAYWKNGERDEALCQARKLPNLFKARENALLAFLDGEEKRQIALGALVPLSWSLTQHLSFLAETENDPKWLEKAAQIREILFAGDSTPYEEAFRRNETQREAFR